MNRTSRLRIIVGGMVGMYPVGGVAWDYLQYVLGLARLGHDVVYHEDTWSWPYHPLRNTYVDDGDYSAQFIGGFFARYAPELGGRWHYLHLHDTSYGMTRADFDAFAADADLFINVSGACMIPQALSGRCIKVFLDTDPGYNQIMLSEKHAWSENIGRWCASVLAHDRFFTYAENIAGDDCLIPKLGIDWRTTRMPVVTDLWRAYASPDENAAWTTVMSWNTFKGPLTLGGREYFGKAPEFMKIMALPRQTQEPMEVAVGGLRIPRDDLIAHGWRVVDAPRMSVTADAYRDYILGSRGELSVAKNVYVALRSGWFSCRSACYLAAGRPVIVQDTGFSRLLPADAGLYAFTTAAEAVDGLGEITADYARHARVAREIADACFDHRVVLERFIADCAAGAASHGHDAERAVRR